MVGTIEKIIVWMTKTGKEGTLFDVKLHREKRSLSQNAYYWQLVGLMAEHLRTSKTELHNVLLRDYGQMMVIDGQAVRVLLPDTEGTAKTTLKSETVHYKPTSQVTTLGDGITYRTYCLLKGSHDMDTREMSALLDGCIAEAKEMGIETLPPEEIARMKREAERRGLPAENPQGGNG